MQAFALSLLLLAAGLFAQGKPGSAPAPESALLRVAVVGFSGDPAIDPDDAKDYSETLTRELAATNAVLVLEVGKVDSILKARGFAQRGSCTTFDCRMQLGTMLGVDFLIAAKVKEYGNVSAFHLDIVDAKSGVTQKTIEATREGELDRVATAGLSECASLLSDALSRENYVSTVLDATKEHTVPDSNESRLGGKNIPAGAIPKAQSKAMSAKRKWALAIWGASLVSAGGGYYFNGKMMGYNTDYEGALAARDYPLVVKSFNNIQVARSRRDVGYGISAGTLLVGAVLWFWPEGK